MVFLLKIFQQYQVELRQKMMKKDAEESLKNKELGAKFLMENAKKEGVVTTPSGLQYKVMKEGNGANLLFLIKFKFIIMVQISMEMYLIVQLKEVNQLHLV